RGDATDAADAHCESGGRRGRIAHAAPAHPVDAGIVAFAERLSRAYSQIPAAPPYARWKVTASPQPGPRRGGGAPRHRGAFSCQRRHQLGAGRALIERHHGLDDAIAHALSNMRRGECVELLHHGLGLEPAARETGWVGDLHDLLASVLGPHRERTRIAIRGASVPRAVVDDL